MSGRCTDAVVFDFDGVLVESTSIKTSAFREIYSRYGDDVADAALAYHLEHQGTSRYVKFRHLHETLLGITLDDEGVDALAKEFAALVLDAVVAAPVVAGALEFLAAHCDRLPLFVASSTPQAELEQIVERRKMSPYFRSVHGIPAKKREVLARVAASHAAAPDRVLMVGDALEDLNAARAAGTRFVGRRAAGGIAFPCGIPVLPDLNGLARYVR